MIGTPVFLGTLLSGRSSLLSGLAAYWALEDTTDKLGVQTLTNNNAATFAAGQLSNGVSLASASSQSLSVADFAGVDLSGDRTFCLWTKLTDLSSSYYQLGKDAGSGTSRDYFLRFNSATSRFEFQCYNTSQTAFLATANNFGAPSSGTWYFLCAQFTQSSGLVSLSVNNGTANTASLTGTAQASSQAFYIGQRGNNTGYLKGMVDAVTIHTRLLTAGEITTLYNNGSGLEYPWR